MFSNSPNMFSKFSLSRSVLFGFHGAQVSLQWYLCVNYDHSCMRQMHNHVRTQSTLPGLLLKKIAMVQHAGHLNDTLQLDLAPSAACPRVLQRTSEIRCLRPQLPLRSKQIVYLLSDACIGTGPRLLNFLDLAVELFE
jgi:hypothetical protein